MSMELLRLGLQFFAGETKEEEDKVIIPGEEGVPGTSGVAGSTPPAYTMPENTVAAPVAQDFDTWYKANGGMDEAGYYAKYDLDPDRDYQNTVNTLNYDYQTSMATYGEQAEKMYQMGLQNSGVSDIFQANAFSSYLGNMNQAAADRITARKKNKAAFNDYVSGMKAQHGQYETGIKTEYDTKLNSALTYAMSKYNGYNLQDVLNELGVSGYYTEIVDEIGKRLSGMDATSLQATTETVLAQDIINNISGFTGSENDLAAAISMYKGMYGGDVIGKAFERAKTIYQNSAAGQDATLNSYIDQYYGSYTGDINTLKLDGIADEGMRDKVKTGIQQRFEEEKSNLMSEILKLYPNYTASADEDATIDAMFGNKYGANVLTAAKDTLKTLYQSGEGYENTQVQSYIDQYYGSYTGDINTLKLDGIADEGMRDKVKTGIEEKFRAQVGKAITAIGNWLNSNGIDYSGTQAQKDALKAALGFEYGTNELDYALSQYDVFGNYAKEEYANSPEGIQASVDELVSTWTASFDPNVSKEEFVTKMITGEDGKVNEDLRANAEAAWEQMNSAYLKRRDDLDAWVSENFWDESGNNTWDGSELSKATLKEILGTTVTEKEYEYIVDKLNTRMQNLVEGAKKTAGEKAESEIKTVKDNLTTIGNDRGYLTIKDYFDAYDQYGAIGENYGNEFSQPAMDEIDNIVNGIIRDALSGTTSDLASIDTANTFVGIISKDDIANWKTMSNDQRRRAVLNGVISSGRFNASERNEIVSTYVTKKVQDIVDTDNSNAKASGLADAGELVNYINSLGLNKQEKQKAMESIRRGMSFRIEGDQINWYGSVKGAEATFRGVREKGNKVTDSTILSMLGDVSGSNIKTYKAINGVLYELVPATDYTNAYWVEMKPENIEIVGDGHTNTAEQRQGIYDLLVYMLEHKNKLATDAGYIEGKLPTSTTVTIGGSSENGGTKGKGDTQGGRTGDFAVANK